MSIEGENNFLRLRRILIQLYYNLCKENNKKTFKCRVAININYDCKTICFNVRHFNVCGLKNLKVLQIFLKFLSKFFQLNPVKLIKLC